MIPGWGRGNRFDLRIYQKREPLREPPLSIISAVQSSFHAQFHQMTVVPPPPYRGGGVRRPPIDNAHRTTQRPDVNNINDLAGALRGVPALAGAACVGRHDVFDTADKHPDPALKICASCPAMALCRDWAATQAWVAGTVVGGRITAKESKPRPASVVLTREERLKQRAEQLRQQWLARQQRAQDRRGRTKRAATAIITLPRGLERSEGLSHFDSPGV